jgi:hypothetical protein
VQFLLQGAGRTAQQTFQLAGVHLYTDAMRWRREELNAGGFKNCLVYF